VKEGALLSSRALALRAGSCETLVQELQRPSEEGSEFPERVLVSGGDEEIYAALREKLGPSVERWSPVASTVEASTYGLALRGLVKLPLQIDLLPPERRQRKRELPTVVMFTLLALLVILGGALGISSAYRERKTLNLLNQRIAAVKAQADEVEALKTEFTSLRHQLQVLEGIAGSREGTMVVKDLVSSSRPTSPERALTDGNKLMIRGTTGTAPRADAAFERSSAFENAAQPSDSGSGKDGWGSISRFCQIGTSGGRQAAVGGRRSAADQRAAGAAGSPLPEARGGGGGQEGQGGRRA
jgi:hypothetical protein